MKRQRQVGATLNAALEAHRAGRLDAARKGYESVLKALPEQPDALHLLGSLHAQLGRHEQAVGLVNRAIRAHAGSASYHMTLATSLQALGRVDQAVAALRTASRLSPGSVEPVLALAGLLAAAGRWADAETPARTAARSAPDNVLARFRLGLVMMALGRDGEAVPELVAAGRRAPQEWEIHRRLTAAALSAGAPDLAWKAARRGILLAPERPGLHQLAAIAAADAGGPADPALPVRLGLAADPRDPSLWARLGRLQNDEQRYRQALGSARRALVAAPEQIDGVRVMARAGVVLSRFDVARRAAVRGLCLGPDDAELLYELAQAEKAVGDLGRAWELDEHRVRSRRFHLFAGLPALWPGPGTPVGRLLIATEQGIGDELLFLSCLPDLLRDVPDPVVETDARFHPLIRRSFPDVTPVARQASRLQDGRALFDYAGLVQEQGLTHYLHAGSLPRLYRADRDRPATQRGYLRPDPLAAARWRDRLAALGPEPKVGICWRSIVQTAVRTFHFAPLEAWVPLLQLPGIRFVCLQYDDCRAELDLLRDRHGLSPWVPEDLDQLNDLDGTAALVAGLDAVVSAATSVCMLAASLGVPTVRCAHSVYSICSGRDLFFANMVPMLDADETLDPAEAVMRASRRLPDLLNS